MAKPVAAASEELRRKLAADPHRPQYHFLPPANWMNDPNGPIYFRGKYHMFYQHHPYGAYWANMHWGHAVSEDLVHWKHLPIALTPTPGGPDKDGVFTGCAVDDNGVPTLVFTGVNPEVQMIATSDEQMLSWKKYDGNPIVKAPPEGLKVTGFRDPCVWKQGAEWRMIIGSGVKSEGGMALMYRSGDLLKWEYVHPLAKGPVQKPAKPGGIELSDMWECPDFFPLGPKHVLVVSTGGKAPYFTGAYDGRHFEPLSLGQTDFGCAYAPKTMLDAKGRRIYWAWIRERRTKEAHTAAGWAGVMSLPRVMTLGTGPALGMEPAPELRSLRTKNIRIGPSAIPPGEQQLLKGIHGDCLEIVAELDPGDARQFGLRVRCSPNGEEQVRIYYQRSQELLAVDTTRSSLGKEVSTGVEQGSFHLAAGERLRLQVFLDGSVIEVFANGRFCLTERTYPTRPDSLGIGLFAERGMAKLVSMDVWQVRPISPDRLTS